MRKINLLPWREERRRKRQSAFVMHLGASAVAAIVIAGGIHMFMQDRIDNQNARNQYLNTVIKDLDRKIASIKALKKKKQELIDRMNVIEKLQSSRPTIVHLMQTFVQTLPNGIQLTDVTVKHDKQIRIQGNADAQARVADYLRALNSSQYIDGAIIVGSGILAQEAGKRTSPSGRYVFSITASVKEPKSKNSGQEK